MFMNCLIQKEKMNACVGFFRKVVSENLF